MSINLSGLTVTVTGAEGTSTLLREISCTLNARTTAVLGANGSGKSTLAKTLAGLFTPASGTASINGVDVVRQAKKLRGQVGFLIANAAAQVIMPTVAEDVALTLRGRGMSRVEIDEAVQNALAEHELTELAQRSCLSLSSGQLQRLALCSVLIGQPQVVIADEPTSMLDARHHRLVARRLFSLPPETQLVLVTHDLELARRCEEALLIQDGALASHGRPDDVIDQYLTWLDDLDGASTS